MKANDEKYYRCNLEVDGIYYCENNVIIKDGEVIKEYSNNKERYVVIEQYIIDRKEKKIYLYDEMQAIRLEDLNKKDLQNRLSKKNQ